MSNNVLLSPSPTYEKEEAHIFSYISRLLSCLYCDGDVPQTHKSPLFPHLFCAAILCPFFFASRLDMCENGVWAAAKNSHKNEEHLFFVHLHSPL